ncbi:DNA ligase [Streptomyces sodiiphilus]|uniref:DNA ligase n=1 Tax=Streptomyces sodiiphilus TaxID=226217 RepID=A0ABP5B7X4_9ACTN
MSALRPPVRVALARTVRTLPTRGDLAYEPKFDGHRMVAFRTGSGVLLQARSGRLVTDSFPDLATAVERLPEGTVLDGEAVVWTRAGRTDFAAVQRRAAAGRVRAAGLARELPASYAVFDLLALGREDLRRLPLRERRARLTALLEQLGPPVQAVPQTLDPHVARAWYDSLPPTGVEGLVIKRLDQPYRAGRGEWRKLRHSETREAAVVGTVGPAFRPRALALVLPDDDTPVISAPLAPAQRAEIASALAGPAAPDPATALAGDGTVYRPVPSGLTVEVLRSTTRHAETVVTRLRRPE